MIYVQSDLRKNDLVCNDIINELRQKLKQEYLYIHWLLSR